MPRMRRKGVSTEISISMGPAIPAAGRNRGSSRHGPELVLPAQLEHGDISAIAPLHDRTVDPAGL